MWFSDVRGETAGVVNVGQHLGPIETILASETDGERGERMMIVAASSKLLVASSLPGVSWTEISPYIAEQVRVHQPIPTRVHQGPNTLTHWLQHSSRTSAQPNAPHRTLTYP